MGRIMNYLSCTHKHPVYPLSCEDIIIAKLTRFPKSNSKALRDFARNFKCQQITRKVVYVYSLFADLQKLYLPTRCNKTLCDVNAAIEKLLISQLLNCRFSLSFLC